MKMIQSPWPAVASRVLLGVAVVACTTSVAFVPYHLRQSKVVMPEDAVRVQRVSPSRAEDIVAPKPANAAPRGGSLFVAVGAVAIFASSVAALARV